MLKRKFYNTLCSIYKFWTQDIDWSLVQDKSPTALYDNIYCSKWSNDKKYWESQTAIQSNWNWYEINVSSEYSLIEIWDIFTIDSQDYKVTNVPVPHHNFKWVIDNFQIYVNLTTND